MIRLILILAVVVAVINFATFRVAYWYGHLGATQELALKCIEKRSHK